MALTLLCLTSGLGQSTLRFSFEQDGLNREGTLRIEFNYQDASPRSNGARLPLSATGETAVLIFSDLSFGSDDLDASMKLVLKKGSIHTEGQLQADNSFDGRKIFPGRVARVPVNLLGTGNGYLEVSSLNVLLPDNGEVPARMDSRFSLNVEVVEGAPASGGNTDPETEGTDDPELSPDDQLWEEKFRSGARGIDEYLNVFANGNHAKDAKDRLTYTIKRKESDAPYAIEVFLRQFPNDAFAPEAKKILRELEQPAVVETPEKKDLVEEEYRKIRSITNPEERRDKLRQFIDKHPDAPQSEMARADVPTVIEITPGENLNYFIRLKYALAPFVETVSDSLKVKAEIRSGGKDFILEVTLTADSNYLIAVRDTMKSPEFAGNEISLGNLPIIIPAVFAATGDTIFSIRINLGNPPFRLDFYWDNQRVWSSSDIPATDVELAYLKQELLDSLGGVAGNIRVMLVEPERNNQNYEAGQFVIEGKKFPWLWVGIGAGLLVAAMLINHGRKKARRRELEAKLKKAEEKKAKELPIPSAASLVIGQLTDDPASIPTVQVPDEQAVVAEPSKFRISKKSSDSADKYILEEKEFLQHVGAGGWFKADLTRHWSDTAIPALHFSPQSIRSLSGFLRSQNIHEIVEKEGTVPEIGGFLLGKYWHDEANGQYHVAAEEFVPVSPKMHNVYKLEFSTGSIARELGDAKETFPELTLVAWFHTHPGHGLFLSSPDLAIHEGFFKEPFQFAMETDSLTENLETGFFTRTRSGKVNNKADLKPASRWLDWTEIEKYAR